MAARPMPGNTRVTGKEQFYTPPEVASATVARILSMFPRSPDRLWVEPAGGSGSFLDAFSNAGIRRVWACDIEPKDPRVERLDFLAWRPSDAATGAVVATNPPFGRNNALSVPFFNKAASFASVIAFIVPRSWRKWSVIDRLDANFHLISDEDLVIDYHTARGVDIAAANGRLRTCVQIWVRRADLRSMHIVEDRGYITKIGPAGADVSLTVFGRGAGTVKVDFPRVPNTTQMFLEVRDKGVIEVLRSLDYGRFSKNVAYTEALSLKEIRFLLNEHYDAKAAGRS